MTKRKSLHKIKSKSHLWIIYLLLAKSSLGCCTGIVRSTADLRSFKRNKDSKSNDGKIYFTGLCFNLHLQTIHSRHRTIFQPKKNQFLKLRKQRQFTSQKRQKYFDRKKFCFHKICKPSKSFCFQCLKNALLIQNSPKTLNLNVRQSISWKFV